MITPVTVLGMKIGYLMGGAIITEIIFSLPGMGTALFEGINGNERFSFRVWCWWWLSRS